MKTKTDRTMFKPLTLLVIAAVVMAGCGQSGGGTGEQTPPVTTPPPIETPVVETGELVAEEDGADAPAEATASSARLYVTFGDDGTPFVMHLYDNDTAAAIAGHVGTADWRIPIYSYDDYENWEVMQYYDIPGRYEIPSSPERVTAESSGTVYYSEPNRIVLFYGDAEVSGDYTPVGYFEPTEEFVSAVRDNPVLEGWGNKIILIRADE